MYTCAPSRFNPSPRMTTTDDTATLLRSCFDEGWYWPDPEMTVDRSSRVRSIRMQPYLVSASGTWQPLPSKRHISRIHNSFKTNLQSIRRVPVAREMNDIWQYTCLSYAYGPDQIDLPPIMADYPGSRKEVWFDLKAAALPECTHETAETDKGDTQTAA